MVRPQAQGRSFVANVTEDGIAVITMEYPPVNALNIGLRNNLVEVMRQLEGRDPSPAGQISGIVLHGAGRAFCAGADISAFGKAPPKVVELGRPTTDPFGFGLEDNLLGVPVVAAVHGFALGGGLEVALGCHYRVASEDAFFGLPEVNIGLLPGAQGTQRLPRLVGAQAALDMMLTGAHIPAARAKAMGLVDAVVPKADLITKAVEFCRAKKTLPVQPRSSQIARPTPIADWSALHKDMARKRPGEPAPPAIIRCVEQACQASTFADGVLFERGEFAKLVSSPESKALRHLFAAERLGSKIDDISPHAKPTTIHSVGIVGAGLMGGGIGMCCANVGIRVTLLDIDEANLKRGLALVDKNYARSSSMSQERKDKARALIVGATDYEALRDCDVVVEAVFESLDVKLDIFRRLDGLCKPSALLVSNTSALDIDAMAQVVSPQRRDKVMGTHFFSPANVMKLLENVRGQHTSDDTIASMMQWGRRIGKWTILVGNCQGFVGNRMLAKYTTAARQALARGALPHQVDEAAMRFGMRMGPFAMADLVGLDLGIQAIKKTGEYRPDKIPQHALVSMGRCGQKTNAGWYDYTDGRKPTPSPAVSSLLARLFPQSTSPAAPQDLTSSLFMPLINEGFKVLEEGMAQRPSDIDVCFIYGYNFPKFRGGPMHYADQIGLERVRDQLLALGEAPARLLEECVAQRVGLAEFWAREDRAHPWGNAKGKTHPSRAISKL